MKGFVDETLIEVSSGAGGAGSVHFRREKYIPRGGPDGGDGGCGGKVCFTVKRNLKTLSRLKMRRIFKAEDGKAGRERRRHGRDGKDVEIEIPPGTRLIDPDTGRLIKDFCDREETWTFLKGGRGGKGNWHFRSATRQAPMYAQPGKSNQSTRVLVEMNIIADIGLVGLPNSGKSTLLSLLTNAHPKIAAYPFTTRIPNIGVLRKGEQDIIIADIPGIIEGAATGRGLGLGFLKHIKRTRALLFLIDLSDTGWLDTKALLEKELQDYQGRLLGKPRLFLGTKLDLPDAPANLESLQSRLKGEEILGISARHNIGIPELIDKLGRIVNL